MALPAAALDIRLGWLVPAILVVLGWGATAFWGYHTGDVDLSNRVTAVETKQDVDSKNEKERLDRIENKLDRLFYEVTGKRP